MHDFFLSVALHNGANSKIWTCHSCDEFMFSLYLFGLESLLCDSMYIKIPQKLMAYYFYLSLYFYICLLFGLNFTILCIFAIIPSGYVCVVNLFLKRLLE